jgi:enoyl-CoA hydratase/carnithine racemase
MPAARQTQQATEEPLVVVRREARVAWLVIDRPEVHNALSTATNHLLRTSLEELDADPAVGCIVIRGAGERSFSAGADLREVSGKPVEELQTEFDSIASSIETMRTIGTPVIAAVHGYAFGGGLGLVAAADLAIASEDALFATPEITLGRFPLIISAAILRSVPEKKAFEMAFTGRRFTAAEARDMGLVNTVVPRERLWDDVRGVADTISSYSSGVLRMGKQALHQAADMEFRQSLQHLRNVLTLNALTADSAEGVQAFLERRQPRWNAAATDAPLDEGDVAR